MKQRDGAVERYELSAELRGREPPDRRRRDAGRGPGGAAEAQAVFVLDERDLAVRRERDSRGGLEQRVDAGLLRIHGAAAADLRLRPRMSEEAAAMSAVQALDRVAAGARRHS